MATTETILPAKERVFSKIYVIRDQKVLLDEDLAEMYGVQTKILNQAVKRNSVRFPADFMFQLTDNECKILKSQIVTSRLHDMKTSWGGRRKLPLAFTEQGVSMLASVLRSQQAISVKIQIMRLSAADRSIC